jgi:hypothetical protein
VAVPGEAGVITATFILPLNAAINPFLYTLNLLLEQRRRDKEQRLLVWFREHPQWKEARQAGSPVE